MNTKKDQSGQKEFRLHGLSASPGIAVGKGYIYRKEQPEIQTASISGEEVQKHLRKFEESREIIETELHRLKRKEIDQTTIDIIDAQIEMVKDPELQIQVKQLIETEQHPVDSAIYHAFKSFLDVIKSSSNEVTKERIVDVEDVRDRLIQVATNHSFDLDIEPGSVVVAEDLSPREVIQFSDHSIGALITDHGGQNSHASIIARSMGIPSIVGVKRASQLIEQDSLIIVDGEEGIMIVNPENDTLEHYREKLAEQDIQEEELHEILSKPSRSKDGVPFILRANIEFTEEIPNLKKYGARGIGLLRTESVYIRKEHFEDQEKQVSFYSEILRNTDPDPVTIRLFDAGGDKFFSLGSEEKNPFLGWRGIRMLLDERDLLREQLGAIMRVSAEYSGRIQLLVPMISTLDELIEVKKEIFNVQGDLLNEGIQVDESIPLGIMVEVPSVAIQADKFAPQVDFFSIGSNDLTQYTLAVDRGNELISNLYQHLHPSIWRLIRQTVDAAEDAEVEITVCGEMASYPAAAACLLGMGIRELSMSPASIPKVKSLLMNRLFEEMKALAEGVLQAASVSEVNELFENWRNN